MIIDYHLVLIGIVAGGLIMTAIRWLRGTL